MSSGRVHAASSIGAALGVGVGYAIANTSTDLIGLAGVAFGVLLGTLIGPDLDINSAKNISYHYAGKFGLRWPWSVFWRPYRLGLRHRSPLSHWPLISTLLRIFYIGLPLSLIFWRDDKATPALLLFGYSLLSQGMSLLLWALVYWYWSDQLGLILLYVIGGLVVSDTQHWLFDVTTQG